MIDGERDGGDDMGQNNSIDAGGIAGSDARDESEQEEEEEYLYNVDVPSVESPQISLTAGDVEYEPPTVGHSGGLGAGAGAGSGGTMAQSSGSLEADNENGKNSIDRIADVNAKISCLKTKVKEAEEEAEEAGRAAKEAGRAAKEAKTSKIELLQSALEKYEASVDQKTTVNKLLHALRAEEEQLSFLKDELKTGSYFAKTDDIYPRDQYEIVDKSGFEGSADNMMREHAPCADGSNVGFYENVMKAFLKHLPTVGGEGENQSVATEEQSFPDMNSIAPSDASNCSEEAGSSRGSRSSGKSKDRVVGLASTTFQSGRDISCTLKSLGVVKNSIIPCKQPGHKGHLIPDGSTCCPWWPLVCLWAIGKIDALTEVYERIELEDSEEERRKLEERIRKALVMLATGTNNASPGMRSCEQNILYVPNPHAEYYDTGYNWVIIPIMTLEEMKQWKGGLYEVAIFVGEHAEEMQGSRNEKYNHFQDGPTRHSAVLAEEKLFCDMDSKNIRICSKEDLVKVTDVLILFLKAFADLHTRGCDEYGNPREGISPKQWGIINLAEAVEEACRASGDKKIDSKQGTEDHKNTKMKVFKESKKGIENLIERLLNKGSGGDEKNGLQIPKPPNTNCFGGKHVFKASVTQAHAPDPLFVGGKGTLNFGRQWGIRLMPACSVESNVGSSSSSWSSDNGPSDVARLPSKDFSGFEIAFPTPESLPLDRQVDTSDDEGLYEDALSDVTTKNFDSGYIVPI